MDHRHKPESKKRIVQCAHHVLLRDGASAFSLRKVAAECGCGVSSLYRHFSGRDELLLHAQVWFITAYLKEIADSWSAAENTLYHYFRIERTFAKYSFQEPALFFDIYFGPLSGKMDEILRQHLSLFPERYDFVTDEMRDMFAVPNGLASRNLETLLRCRDEGFFAGDEAAIGQLNELAIHLYRGYLNEAVVRCHQGEPTDEIAQQYLDAHWALHRRFLEQPWSDMEYRDLIQN